MGKSGCTLIRERLHFSRSTSSQIRNQVCLVLSSKSLTLGLCAAGLQRLSLMLYCWMSKRALSSLWKYLSSWLELWPPSMKKQRLQVSWKALSSISCLGWSSNFVTSTTASMQTKSFKMNQKEKSSSRNISIATSWKRNSCLPSSVSSWFTKIWRSRVNSSRSSRVPSSTPLSSRIV